MEIDLYFQQFINYGLQNIWVFVLVYYVAKQVTKVIVTIPFRNWSDLTGFLQDVGPDLCFFAITLYAAALINDNSKIYTEKFYGISIFIGTWILFLAFFLSYLLYKLQRYLGEKENRRLGVDKDRENWKVLAGRITLTSFSWVIGIFSFMFTLGIAY